MSQTTTNWEDVQLSDSGGHPVTLGQAWAKQPVLLVFVRHFG